MLITVINPNTTASMTATIEQCARAVAGPGTRVEAVTPTMGPASIESHVDEALSVPGILEQIALGEQRNADGYVIACFGDPGMDAAREAARGPVVGIAEAAMHAASFLGRAFSVVTTLERTTGRAWDLVAHYGMSQRCGGVHERRHRDRLQRTNRQVQRAAGRAILFRVHGPQRAGRKVGPRLDRSVRV